MTVFGVKAEGKKPSIARAEWLVMTLNEHLTRLQILKVIRGLMEWSISKSHDFVHETIEKGVEPLD